jgi:hypothetical protein
MVKNPITNILLRLALINRWSAGWSVAAKLSRTKHPANGDNPGHPDLRFFETIDSRLTLQQMPHIQSITVPLA